MCIRDSTPAHALPVMMELAVDAFYRLDLDAMCAWVQLVGGALVLVGVGLVQVAGSRAVPDAEDGPFVVADVPLN